jgi:hypothetical protein
MPIRTLTVPDLPAVPSPPPRTAARHPPPPGKPASAAGVPLGHSGPALDATTAAIRGADSFADAADAAMFYLAGRFRRVVWFAIHEGAALGERGHGDQLTAELVQSITLPLSAPSLVQLAHATWELATAAPADAGAIQDRLARTLGYPQAAAAMPVDEAAVIAVGDPIGDPATALAELEQLGQALGSAYRRTAG